MRHPARWMVLAVAVLAAAGCDGNPPAEGASPGDVRSGAGSPAESAEPAVPVRTWEIRASEFEEILEVTGVLQAWDEVQVSSELGGYVRDVAFEKGETLRSGQVLARIGDDLAAVRLEQARAEAAEAEETFRKASALFERQAVPEQELIAATARRDRSRAAVREHEILLERSLVRAPIDGVAVDRQVDAGEVVPPGAPVTMVQRIDRLKATASVPDTEISWIAPGSPATVEVDAWPGRPFDARVSFVSPAADPVGRTFEVEAAISNTDLALRPGMVCRARLLRRSLSDAIAVPLDALVTRVDGQVAFVVRDCRAELREVEVAAVEGDRALVGAGLSLGEELVVEGQRDLSDGQPVESESCP